MNKVNSCRVRNQTISENDLRAKIYELAYQNGGLVNLAKRSGLTHNTLWEQLNRNRGILARIIPPITKGIGDLQLLQLLADACDCLVIKKVRPAKCIRSVRKHELDLYAFLTRAVELTEEIYSDGIVTRIESKKARYHLNELRRMIAELDLRIHKASL